jgi:hypothetical protein
MIIHSTKQPADVHSVEHGFPGALELATRWKIPVHPGCTEEDASVFTSLPFPKEVFPRPPRCERHGGAYMYIHTLAHTWTGVYTL